MVFDKITRQKIRLAGKPIEVLWPDDTEPIVGNKYTLQSAPDRPGETEILVDSRRELDDGKFMATVRLDDDPVRLLGKAGGYATSSQGAISTRKAAEQDAMSGPQFRGEVEPEAVDEATQRRITAKGRHNRAEFQEELAKEDKELAAELARRQERAVRDRLRLACRGLSPDGARALLASIEHEITEAESRHSAA